jgi:hypothetical protein
MKESVLDFTEEYDDYDYDGDNISFDSEPSLAQSVLESYDIRSSSDFLLDANYLATNYIKSFFDDKKDKYGEEISSELLNCKKRISVVLNTNIIDSVKRVYSVLGNYIKITEEDISFAKKTGDVTQEIKLVNETLKSLYEFGVPQQFAGGMVILYLEFCEGIDFGI